MANKAYLIKNSDSKVIVYAEDLTESDKQYKYFCCGKVDGQSCGCPLMLVTPMEYRNYFSALEGHHHMQFCEYDESGVAKIVKHLNRKGPDSLNNLLLTFSKVNKVSAPKLKPGISKEDGLPYNSTEGLDDIQLPIERKAEDPKNVKQLYILLSNLGPDAIYAGIPVRDILFDKSNKERLENEGLHANQIAVVACHRYSNSQTVIARNFYNLNNDYFIARYYSHFDNDPEILFAFQVDEKAKTILFDKSKGKRLILINRWTRSEKNRNLYLSETPITNKCIYSFNPNSV